jgi:hypothetical protein
MLLELIPRGAVNTSELLENLNAPKPTSSSSPTLTPPSPVPPRANSIHDYPAAISRDGTLCAIGKYNLILLLKVGDNWKISKLVEDESQAQPGYV